MSSSITFDHGTYQTHEKIHKKDLVQSFPKNISLSLGGFIESRGIIFKIAILEGMCRG